MSAETELELVFPDSFSPTSLSALTLCHQKWFYSYCFRLRRAEARSVHLDAGSAFAKGTEAARNAFYADGKPEQEAVEIGLAALEAAYKTADVYGDSVAKSLGGMLGALRYYFDVWPMSRDYFEPVMFGEKSGVEFTGHVPLPIAHPISGDPLTFQVKLDMLARYKSDGAMWVLDDKTGSSLGPQWKKQWRLDSQITGYTWAIQQFGYPAAGALIRGIGILKTQYKTDEQLEPRSKVFLDGWYEQMLRKIRTAIYVFESYRDSGLEPERAYDKNICGMYSGCGYADACASDDPMLWVRQAKANIEAARNPGSAPAVPDEFASFFKPGDVPAR